MHSTLCRCLLFLCVPALPLSAQDRTSPPLRRPPDLPQVTRRAGMIFAGTVTSILPVRAPGSLQMESVQVTFQVEQAVRGARIGQSLTIREWAGLWSSGERYRVGERLMLFLYPPSKLGLTSPVGGPAGRFVIDRNGRVQLNPLQQQGARIVPSPPRIQTDRRVTLREFTRTVRRLTEE
jgi:hypothetical protein